MIKQIRVFLKTAKNPLLVILGPTASGKTKLAVELAKIFNGEIINADSRQIYQDIIIGNALPTPEERQGVPHHLFSVFPPDRIVTVAEYKILAEKTIEDVLHRKKIPVLCGGTFLWIDAVVDQFAIPPVKANPELRKKMRENSVESLLSDLQKVDYESAASLQKERNKRYIIRALEIFHGTGRKKSQLAKKGIRKYEVLKIGLNFSREELYRRINDRTARQLEQGLIEEVEAITKKYTNDWPALTAIGVKEVIPYLRGQISKPELLQKLQQHNRNYAKRQLTWLRKDAEIHWISEKR